MHELINRVQQQLNENHAIESEDIQALVDYASDKRKLKIKKKDMPVKMVWTKDYEEMIHVLKQVNGIFSMMDYNPDAKVINQVHKDIKEILDRHDF